jgi:AAA domain
LSCSPAATATSRRSPASSNSPGAARRPRWSAAAWPPATATPRPLYVTRHTGLPTSASSTNTGSNDPLRCASGSLASPAPLVQREAAVRARLLSTDGLTRQDATFEVATITRAVFAAAAGLLDATEVRGFLERFQTGPDLVPVATPAGPRLTTSVLLNQERAILTTARTKVRTTVAAPTPAQLQQAALQVRADLGHPLSTEQRAALEYLCIPVGWAALEGHAGTGKTTAVRAYESNQQPTVVVATAADTAHRTARDLGLARGYTVEAFTHAVHTGTLHPNERTVVIVEEAVMVDTPRMHCLLQAAGPAIIRTLGDPQQAQAVGPGGWHHLVDQVIGGHAELTQVIRQRDPEDRAVCQAIRDGDAAWALHNLNDRGRIHLSPNPQTAIKEIVHAWDHHRRRHGLDGVRIVTDTDNHTIDTLNAVCQARRLATGELHGPAIEVVDQPTGRREHLHTGDRIRFTHPHRAGIAYVANGTAAQVLHVDPTLGQLTIACDDGPSLTLQPASLTAFQPIRLGYADHALRLQGGQAVVILILPGSWQTSRQSAYSMLTRCVEEVHVFLDAQTQRTAPYHGRDPIQALTDRWSDDGKKLSATARIGVGIVSEPVAINRAGIALSGPECGQSEVQDPTLDLTI